MAEAGAKRGLLKTGLGALLGLFSGAAAMYATAVFNTVVKPPLPVANFAVDHDGLTVTCANHAAGQSGWWDFGDGSPLEPFDANQPSVAHTYAKPGSYTVKLTVRNFLNDENDRSVPVDLSAVAPQQLPPSIAALSVEPIAPQSVAPATFRVKGEVKNAERVILDLGGDKPEVADSGPFERLVVFDKPGQFPIQLTGLSGKQAVKQSATVTVSPAQVNSLSVVLRVTDSGTRVERRQASPTIPVPAVKGAKTFEKTVAAEAGYTIADAKVGKVASPAVKSVKAEVSADRRSVKLSGEWAGEAKSDVLVPLALTEERTVPVSPVTQPVSASLTPDVPAVLTLPPAPLGLTGGQRKMQLEYRQAVATGQSVVIESVPDLKLPWSETKTYQGGITFQFKAEPAGDKVRVTVTAGR